MKRVIEDSILNDIANIEMLPIVIEKKSEIISITFDVKLSNLNHISLSNKCKISNN